LGKLLVGKTFGWKNFWLGKLLVGKSFGFIYFDHDFGGLYKPKLL